MNRKTIGIGATLAVLMLAVMTVPAMAGPNTVYFVPQSSGADLGETAYVEVWLDLTDPYGTDPLYGMSDIQVNVTFNPSIGDITACNRVPGDPWALAWGKFQWSDDSWWITAGIDPWEDPTEPYGLDPGVYPIANLTIDGVNAGAMDLHFSRDQPRACDLKDAIGVVYPNQIWTDGTFTCTGPEETYTKTLTEGWNLISLPLTATDMSVSSVIDTSLGSSYDELYKYDASANSYVSLGSTDTMANGVGYFINITATPADWEYGGQPYMSMNEAFSDGLNMIGWLNCTKDISTTSLDDPAKTYYISRWDAATQEYETYNPAAPGDFNDFAQMDRGEGYFVSMKTSGTLTESC